MNVLIIGSGGREHAIAVSFLKTNSDIQIFSAPGNAGLAEISRILNLDITNHSQVAEACRNHQIQLVVIGPEDPLVTGLADVLRAQNISVFGPSKEAAQLEGSKIFAKNFMRSAGVPTAEAVAVTSVAEALTAARNHEAPYVLKANGLAAGKGVFICRTLDELQNASEQIFIEKKLGTAGEKALLEKNLKGFELSVLVLTNGEDYRVLPLAQDHKRLKDGDQGPNTGGMGTTAPMEIPDRLAQKIENLVVRPSIAELKKRNYLFRGVLFIGLMIVQGEPYVLEYNVRFGDPETQVILPLIESNTLLAFQDLAEGKMPEIKLSRKFAFCLVNAAEGYPENSVKNTPVKLPPDAKFDPKPDYELQSYVLHAGTALSETGQLVANGGRVLNIVSVGDSAEEVRHKVYELNEKIIFNGRQFRRDIGLLPIPT